ncbi:uncharacterized protein [Clytia hemisphaerica]
MATPSTTNIVQLQALQLYHIIKEFGSTEYINQLNDLLSDRINYATVSDVQDIGKHIKLTEVFEALWVAENKEWKKFLSNWNTPVTGARGSISSLTSHNSSLLQSMNHATPNAWIGERLMWHSNHRLNLHTFFKGFDPKSCALNVRKIEDSQSRNSKGFSHLSAGRSRRGSTESLRMPNKMKNKHTENTRRLKSLSQMEKELYECSLKCASYTKLSRPRVPSPANSTSSFLSSDIDLEDVVVIDPRMLESKLEKVFNITHDYHRSLRNNLPRMSEEQALAIDLRNLHRRITTNNLTGQTSFRREEINLPTYNGTHCFMTPQAFEEWKAKQLDRVNGLIDEWANDTKKQAMNDSNFNFISGYRRLLQKFFVYDLREKNDTTSDALPGQVLHAILTSDSKLILKEFTLRYGIPDSFHRVCLLELLVLRFQYNDWYLGFFKANLKEMIVFLRSEKDYLVHEEMTMVRESLKMLNTHIGYCFKKLFSIYRRDLFLDGFDAIVSILKKLVKMNAGFDLHLIDQPLEDLMENYFKTAAENIYKDQKQRVDLDESTSRNERRENEAQMTASKFRLILQNCKQNLTSFHELCRHSKILSKSSHCYMKTVATAFYDWLMLDLAELCYETPSDVNHIDSVLVGLSLRLQKLDEEWKDYIEPKKQKWRTNFSIIISYVNSSILVDHLVKEIPEYILKDKMKILRLREYTPPVKTQSIPVNPSNGLQGPSSNNKQRLSFTPSSAFGNYAGRRQSKQNILNNLRRGSRANILGEIGDQDEGSGSGSDNSSDLSQSGSSSPNDGIKSSVPPSVADIGRKSPFRTYAPPSPGSSPIPSRNHTPSSHLSSSSKENNNKDSYKRYKQDELFKKNASKELDETGSILVTNAVVDLTIAVFRLINLTKDICQYTYPLKEISSALSEAEIQQQSDFDNLRRRSCDHIFDNINTLFQSYSTILLALDLCGSDIYQDYLEQKQNNVPLSDPCHKMIHKSENMKKPSIKGCRHALGYNLEKPGLEVKKDCVFITLLLEKSYGYFEVITKEMLYRINDVYSLIELLPFLQDKTFQMMDVDPTKYLKPGKNKRLDGKVKSASFNEQDVIVNPEIFISKEGENGKLDSKKNEFDLESPSEEGHKSDIVYDEIENDTTTAENGEPKADIVNGEIKNDTSKAENGEPKADNVNGEIENGTTTAENGEPKADNVNSEIENGTTTAENGESKADNVNGEVENDTTKAENGETKVDNVNGEIKNDTTTAENGESKADNVNGEIKNDTTTAENGESKADNVNGEVENDTTTAENGEPKADIVNGEIKNDTTKAENGEPKADNVNGEIENGTTTAENGEPKADNVNSEIENGTITAENGESKADNVNGEVENDTTKAENGEPKADNVNGEIENDTTTAENGEPKADNVNGEIENDTTKAENGESKADIVNGEIENDTTKAENGESKADNVNGEIENDTTKAENGESKADIVNGEIENDTTKAENGESKADNVNSKIENDTTKAENGEPKADNVNGEVENDTTKAENGESKADNVNGEVENDTTTAENGESKADNVNGEVENDTTKAENGESKADNVNSKIENDTTTTENGESKADNVNSEVENGTAISATGEPKADNINGVVGSSTTISENGEHRRDKDASFAENNVKSDPGKTDCDGKDLLNITAPALQRCKEHMEFVYNLQIKMLAERAMSIYTKHFDRLICMKLHETSKEFVAQMSPCSMFMTNQLKVFKSYLYQDILEKVVLELWTLIVEKVEKELMVYCEGNEDPKTKSKHLDELLRKQFQMVQQYLTEEDQNHQQSVERRMKNVGKLWIAAKPIFVLLDILCSQISTPVLRELLKKYLSNLNHRGRNDSCNSTTTPPSFEECFYQIRKEITGASDQKTFKGYEFLEFLSPGWLQNKIEAKQNDAELLQYYNQLNEDRNRNKKQRKEQSKAVGRKLLRDFTDCNKMAQSLKLKSEDERALIILKYFASKGKYIEKAKNASQSSIPFSKHVEKDLLIDDKPNSPYTTSRSEADPVASFISSGSIESQERSISVGSDYWSSSILGETIDLGALYEFGDLRVIGREKIMAEFFAGKIHNARRCSGDNKIMRNAYHAVIAKLKHFLRERKYNNGNDADEVRKVENVLKDENVPISNEGLQKLVTCINDNNCMDGS